MGGLGNQMFQYALGKHLALKHHTKLKLDLTFLLDRTPHPNFTFRDYELGIFDINASFATEKEVSDFLNVPRFTHWKDRLKQKIYRYHHFVEQQFNYDKKVLNLPRNAYLEGYWQSEKYFIEIKNILLKDFTITHPLMNKNLEFADKIISANSVSVHFRRGDYLTNETASSILGICDLNYYEKAINQLRKNINNPLFHLFSEDINWLKENLSMRFSGDNSIGQIVIEDDIWLSPNCTITDVVTIKKGAIIAANSVNNKNVEEYDIVGGVPAKKINNRKEIILKNSTNK